MWIAPLMPVGESRKDVIFAVTPRDGTALDWHVSQYLYLIKAVASFGAAAAGRRGRTRCRICTRPQWLILRAALLKSSLMAPAIRHNKQDATTCFICIRKHPDHFGICPRHHFSPIYNILSKTIIDFTPVTIVFNLLYRTLLIRSKKLTTVL